MGCVYGMPLRKRRDPPKGKGFVKHSSKRWVIPDHEPERSPMRHDKQRSRRQSNSARHLLFADDGEKQRPQHCQQQDRHQSFKHDHRGDQPDEAYHDHDHDHHLQKGYVHTHVLNPRNPPKHIEGEQIAAGWPFWLTSVAAEAIKDWIPRRADSFEKIRKIGQGTYSNVYKARDLDTGKIVALKKVRFDNLEPESVRFMAREIQVLRCLDHPNVVKLEGLVTSRISCNLYLVFEYMEHDLAGLCAAPAIKFTESQVKCYMQQLLRGLDHCHSCGVLHRDIKGSNLLIDNSGVLKIADFGLATFFHPEQRQPLTSRVVTLWYRPPELLLGATEYDTAVDLWSAGCILAELLAGEPIMPGRTEVEQLHKIFKLCGSPSEDYWERSKLPHATIFKPQQPYKRRVLETFKDFPVSALALLEVLLAVEPANRGTAASALKSEYLNTNPLPCDPSSLPHYPPCKELDTKVQNDKARRRHRAGGVKAYHDEASRAPKKSKAIPACDANAELACSNQKSCFMAQGSSKRKSQKFNVHLEDGAVGFHIDPPRVICLPTETSGNMQMPFQQLGPSYSGIFAANVSNPACNNTRNHDFLLSHTHSSISSKIPTVELKKQGVDGSITGGHVAMPCTPVSKSHIGADMHKEKATGENNSIDNLQENSNHRSPETDGHSAKHGWPCFQHCDSFHGIDNYHLQCQPVTCYQSNEGIACEQAAMAWLHDDMQGDRIHCSGPLLPPSGNTDEFLKEHEYRIQNAVRRAQQDKGRCQKIPPPQSNRKTMEQQGPVSLSNTNVPYSDDGGKLPSFTSSSMLKPTEVRLTEEVCEMKGCKRSPS